jgi:26S proteasome regulatory subunit N2
LIKLNEINVLFFLAGILSLLDENIEKSLIYALQRLNSIVDIFWPEISDSISKVYE